MNKLRRLDIQTKIILVLIAVIIPTFVLVTVVENKVTRPILEDEMKQIGITSAESMVAKILSLRLLASHNVRLEIEREMQELLYFQPSVIRMDVFELNAKTGSLLLVGSNVEDDFSLASPNLLPIERISSEGKFDDEGMSYWDVQVPIRQPTTSKSKTSGKILGMVRVMVSNRTVDRVLETFWRITASAAAFSVVILIVALSYFLRKTISNEKLLRLVENQNLQLSKRLHEAQRQMMNVEKLAVMGQLTANFAHEIGTPLNAVGGHLQLLREEFSQNPPLPSEASDRQSARFEIIAGQLLRIENIVKGFLQTTSKPASQRQLVDLNGLVDKTLAIVGPRIDSLGLNLECRLDRKLGPVRVVASDLEQILLNLFNNSMDSLHTKSERAGGGKLNLKVSSRMDRLNNEDWAEILVHDGGTGIKKEDLKNIFKPFFTTKPPGEGTGLGLTICQQLAAKYGGHLSIDSKDGSWTEVRLRFPYRANI
jgi:signal transduction histidine kinase